MSNAPATGPVAGPTSDVPVGAQWVAEDAVPVVAEVPVAPEFERAGQPNLDDYIAGLKREFAQATDEARKAIKAELDRVSKTVLETADAAKSDLEQA